MPLPRREETVGAEAPDFVREAARHLRHVSVRCTNPGIGRTDLTDKHWICHPEDTVFHRIFVQGNASPHCNAPGGFGLTCEITDSPDKPAAARRWRCAGAALHRRLRAGRMICADDSVWVSNQVDMPCAYVIYDHALAAQIEVIREWMDAADILLAGCYREWQRYNSDHAFVAGRKAAQLALALNARGSPLVAPAAA